MKRPPLVDLEPWEREELTSAAAALEALRANRQACPSIQILRAAALEALPEGTLAAIRAHQESCVGCRRLSTDLAELPAPESMTAVEDQRIRTAAGLDGGGGRPRRWSLPLVGRWSTGFAYSIAAVAVAAVGATLWLSAGPDRAVTAPPMPSAARRPNQGGRPSASADTDRSSGAAAVLTKPEVRLTLAAITWRSGSNNNRPYVDQIAPALDAFRADRYDDAVHRLERLGPQFPDSVEIPFYLGVSRLFLGRSVEAVPALRRALQLADETFRDDSRWYLALALDRSRRGPEAREQFAILCRTGNRHTTLACSALASFDKR